MQEDAVTGNTTAQKSTNGAAHVVLTAGVAGSDVNAAASADVNVGVTAERIKLK